MKTFNVTIILTVVALLDFISCEDPCIEHTEIEEQYQRSTGYQSNNTADDPYLCDMYLLPGWYHFKGRQGDDMPTYSPGIPACGTQYPVWLNGSLPTIDEGIVNRTACTVEFTNNCSTKYDIRVKNCQDLGYVYYLQPTVSCPEAYCMGSEVHCPPGYASENMFTPDCTKDGFPILQKDPYITFDVEVDSTADCFPKQVVMLCNLEHSEDDIFLDVYWFVGETLIFEHVGENAIHYSKFPAEMKENDWKIKTDQWLDINATCMVRARYKTDSVPGDARSATYYMGFEVKGEYLTVVEGGGPSNYSLRPTVPVLCPYNWEVNTACGCGLDVIVYEPYLPDGDDEPAAPCANGKNFIKQTRVKHEFGATECGTTIPETLEPDEDTWFHIEIYAATDNVYDGDHQILLDVRTLPTVRTHDLWEDYRLPTATVAVLDSDDPIQGMFCIARNDPHMMTFDGRCYENHLAGEFIMYRHSYLPIDVHGYFVDDGSHSDVCGVAVRAGGDLFIYDNCPGESSGRVRLYECNDMVLKVVEIDETSYEIYLPTGGVVLVGTTFIEIHPSAQDLNKTMGLCGTFTHRCDDDFYLPDGSYLDMDEARQECDREEPGDICAIDKWYPDEFSKSWRVPERESLFDGHINDDGRMSDAYYCTCEETDDDQHQTVCSTTPNSDDVCIEGGDVDIERCYEEQRILKHYGFLYSDDVEDDVKMFEYNDTFVAPIPEWSDGWNHDNARQNCTDYFDSSSGISMCQEVEGVDFETATSNCINDIQIMKSAIYNVIHLSGIISSCEKELTRNISMYEYDNETGEAAPPDDELNQICDYDCYKQGDCVEGVCHCYDGFVGKTCGLNLNKIPEIRDLPHEGFCDQQLRPCAETPVQGNYFINTPDLLCRMEPVQVTVDGTHIPLPAIDVPAEYEHLKRIFCPIYSGPNVTTDEIILTTGYFVSVANNAADFSNKVRLVVHDSKCMDCNIDLQCSVKSTSCYIDGTCYAGGETAPQAFARRSRMRPAKLTDAASCYVCDPAKNMYDWTKVYSDECTPSSTNGLVIGGSVLLVACIASIAVAGVIVVKKKKNIRTKVGASSVELDNCVEESVQENFNTDV